MALLEISSREYLRTRTNEQVRGDFENYLRLAGNPTPYFKMTQGGEDELTILFTNMLEALFYSIETGKGLSFRQRRACQLRFRECKSYYKIAKILRCHRDTASDYVEQALMMMVEKMREDSEKETQ